MAKVEKSKTQHLFGQRQGGVVLVVALIFLLLMTLIGVTAMQTTTLDERIANNARQRNLAFQAAEAGLRAGETVLRQPTLPTFGSTTTPGLLDRLSNPTTSATDWMTYAWDSGSQSYSSTLDSALSSQPRYVIELFKRTPGSGNSLDATQPGAFESWYRVTARGSGSGSVGDAVVLLQSVYRR